MFLLIFALFLVNCFGQNVDTISLNGKWKVHSPSNQTINIEGTVPGYIHTDLYNAKIIQDPYYRFNDVEYRWISAVNWTYQRTFLVSKISEEMLLWCDGIDTVANISINGKQIGYSNNQFKRYIFPIKESLKVGENTIQFVFTSAMHYSAKKRKEYPYNVPHDYHIFSNGEQNRNFIRKSQCSFSWDWGPCFLPVGIFKNIQIIGYDNLLLQDIIPRTTDKSLHVKLAIRAQKETSTQLKFEIPNVLSEVKEVTLKKGMNEIEYDFNIQNIELWYPNGYGKQPLYPLTVGLQGTNQEKTKKVAFRKVDLVQTRISKTEKEFYFRINEIIIFLRGANFIPMDSFERQDDKVIDNLIQSAIDANMNTLRIWGGGLYQSNEFYDKCDEKGIVIWQEFMFACSLYPRDDEFLQNVREEVSHNIQRLIHHPSIIIWSGNNENEQSLFAQTWYPRDVNHENKPIYLIDYSKLFLETIKQVVDKEDPTRTYVPSSPSNGLISLDPYVGEFGNPNSEKMGDIHIFEYYNDCTDVTKYLKPRMATEYGWQSFPSHKSLEKISLPNDLYFESPLMRHRQHHANGTDQLAKQIKRHFRDFRDFKDFIYLTQCVQSLCIKSQTEHYRRGSGTNAKTRGSLYWQFNDIWQAPSWSSLEYSGKWKMLHYYSKEFFSSFLISGYISENIISVHLSNDSPKRIEDVSILLEIYQWRGPTVWKKNIRSNLQESNSLEIFNEKFDKLLRESGCSKENCFMTAIATTNNLKSENVIYFSPLKNNLLETSFRPINFELVNERTIKFELFSSEHSPYTFVDVDLKGRFKENGFLLKKGTSKIIEFYGWENLDLETFKSLLTFKSMNSK